MVEYLGLKATGWDRMTETWWLRTLAACLLATIVLGTVYILYRFGGKLYQVWKTRHQLSEVPSVTARYLEKLKEKTPTLYTSSSAVPEPKSFGVYLGSFGNPPTAEQSRLIAQWDTLVLDPLNHGVLDVLAGGTIATHILARLDVRQLVETDRTFNGDEETRALGILATTLTTCLRRSNDSQSRFNAVLLADFIDFFQPVVLNEVVKFINRLGLDVWLEIAPPDYLPESTCREIDMARIRGVVYRNGTILENGDRRNYFQMEKMRTVMRVVAAQKPIGESTLAMWETVDDNVELQHDVLHRSYKWCNYNSAMSWIGPKAALTDVLVASRRTVVHEPIGALMWMKDEKALEAHDVWRQNGKIDPVPCGHNELFDSLQHFIPNLASKLALFPPAFKPSSDGQVFVIDELQWPSLNEPLMTNPFSYSQDGNDYSGLGCFQLGMDCTTKDIEDLLQGQRHTRDLNLLDQLKRDELRRIAGDLLALGTLELESARPARELYELLVVCRGNDEDRLRIYSGLHSGFRTRYEAQIWGMFEQNPIGSLDIYLSGKTEKERAGTILHTFMSSRGYSRHQCFMAEVALATANNTLSEQWQLPTRVVSDIEQLTPTEAMLWLRRLSLTLCQECADLTAKIRACCEYNLMEVPSLAQMRELSSSEYLSGKVSAEDLVASRLAWYQAQGCWAPEAAAATALFKEIDSRLPHILMACDATTLGQLTTVIQGTLLSGPIDACADMFALAVFCAFRRLALNEIYLEVLDRNPLPNGHTIQAACFAEMYALGARCDLYFDMTPNLLGKIIAARYRKYFDEHQPTRREEAFTEIPTAYASMEIDLDPNGEDRKVPFYYRITFLGIFALPALIDITMLTTVGRGLYLTTFMSDTDKTLATTALMVALLVCGGFGSWITSGGSYYLYAMAFPAMSMFVMTRFIAGLAVTLVGGLIAMITIGCIKGFPAGVLFFLYFFFLATYLMLLSVLSIYQLPGFEFQSGRTVIMSCIPILFIGPIVTLWVGHDSVIYLCLLGIFLLSLLLGARRVISQWNSWYLNIPRITDGDVVNWYVQLQRSEGSDILKDVSSSSVPRKALYAAVQKEHKRAFWSRRANDEFVRKMADGYSATIFLLVWFCRFSRTKLPLPYSPTWNLQLKAAVDTMGDMQKGLNMHSAFLHWRHTGADVWCGILYFVIALMDKWTALFTGEALVGLSTASSSEYRLSVGFGLGYYLTGALILDAVSQPLWTAVTQKNTEAISSLDSLREVLSHNSGDRKKLYWSNLAKFFFLHIWGTAVTLALMWAFEGSQRATIMYLAYIGAYSGLLFYQYNRIFTGPEAARCLALGSIVGFIVGIVMHKVIPPFTWSSVISLGSGTWTAAVYSLWLSDIGLPTFRRNNETQSRDNSTIGRPSYTSSSLEPYLDLSPTTLAQTFDNINALSLDLRHRLDPLTHPGLEVKEIIGSDLASKNSALVQAAFPNAEKLLRDVLRHWTSGQTIIEFVSAEHLLQTEQRVRAVSRLVGEQLHIFIVIGPGLIGQDWTTNIRRNCRAIAEAVVQATAEAKLGFSHDQSMMAELLVGDHRDDYDLSVPEGVKYQLERSPAECARVANHGQRTFLRHLLLGIDCDLQWDELPRSARSFLLRRCAGKPGRLTRDELAWLQGQVGADDLQGVGAYVARYNLGVAMSLSVNHYAQNWMEHEDYPDYPVFLDTTYEKPIQSRLPPPIGANVRFSDAMKVSLVYIRHSIMTCLKFVIISLVADPQYQRELEYMLRGQPLIFSWPVTILLNSVWSLCKLLQRVLIPLVLIHGREKVSKVYRSTRGWKTKIKKDRIIIESLNGLTTCFSRPQADGTTLLYQYSGDLAHEPKDQNQLLAVNTYSDKLVLRRREEYSGGKPTNNFIYEYSEDRKTSRGRKLPMQRQCTAGELEGQVVQYDESGYIVSGSAMQGVNPLQFTYKFRKNAKFDDELLRAEYTFPHIQIKVAWCMPPPHRPEREDKWIPYPRVSQATFTQGGDVHHAKWTYDHKFHPVIATTLNGREVPTPAMIEGDWFHVLEKPSKSSFLHDNPLFFFKSIKTNFASRLLGLNIKTRPIPTSRARTHLWKSWKNSKDFDAVTTTWLDELLLRSDRVLRPYWRNRDFGRLDAAGKYLDSQVDTILARVDIDPDISAWTRMAFKISDLYSFGIGGDARINTRTLSTQLQDTDTKLHVLAMDTATWPNEPGGVSACRRDMVNDLKGIRWHIISENANDYGVPKFQTERNVQSLTVLPQWGLDFMNPTHGVFQNTLDSAVVERSQETRKEDIRKHFIPILTKLVKCARTTNLKRHHIEEATNALVDLNTYFESGRSWNDVWMSDTVKDAWRELWLTDDVDDTTPVSKWWNAEHPSLQQLDGALDMWHRYLFIFSIPVPERIPDVFQVSHHFTGATYGIMCKAKRKCALHVWDHCVSFREMTVFLSSAVSFDSSFVNTTLISLGHLACVLIEHHADVVLPCAEYFNPGWEIELGTAEGALQHRRAFSRKIDPVVNGITNMERYKPIETIKTDTPTAVMLSHIRYVKDIKTAIMATDLIVNKWGLRDYRLHIYGDMERAPAYASECQEVIASKGLREHVVLKGLGNPSVVLQDAWLFMNSSISEGLPLAMGEAALTGTPVVCTDVGASFCVVTDRATGKRFSEVVAPNDADSLARAQLRVLALLGPWAPFAEDSDGEIPPTLEFHPTPDQIAAISHRMYAKAEKRRQFGMLGRKNVLNSFSSDRYLREHEQLLWLGKYQAQSFVARSAVSSSNSSGVLAVKEKTAAQRLYIGNLPSTPDSIYQAVPARAWRAWRDSRHASSSGVATPV
ncbi:glycosyltransferase family 4 protein [Aspergillus stella-maris]|uniref:glycosyltransferase family 4 protein n=1 Tax=Aspergillus stella-maris TaxID=1810926 RepID=UPI003CCD761C